VQLTLTERGRELEKLAAPIQTRVQEATGLSAGELAALRDDLQAVAARLRAAHLAPQPV
jgi:DNA-binding MarR family transcriptional regulator